jgi:membrane-bound lytic murein transglycosylase A
MARAFFEGNFIPLRATAAESETGLLTGYYEPELRVSPQKTAEFTAPLHGRPADLVRVDLGAFDPGLAGQQIVGKVDAGALVPYDDRAAIAEDRAPVLAWARPVEAFFLQVQGSGRLIFPDGARSRAAFAAHNGRTYRSIGAVLIERGELTSDTASKAGIEAWIARAGPEAGRALFNENPRYVFFGLEPVTDVTAGPRGAQGAPLTPMASMAVDPAFHAYGAPVWLDTTLPGPDGDWRGGAQSLLVIAQDTGGAITGPLRGDLFFGAGDLAGTRAGSMRAQARWTVLAPPDVAARLIGPRS